jgi:micrococcal nuclease
MATVDKVTDGDTIHVSIDGSDYTLRYIGMNAPESVDPDKPVEPGGPEASEANKELVSGKTVYLEKDVSNTDQYGRLLRYVWLKTAAGWVMVDRQLVLEGWAEARDYPPDTRYHDTLFEAMNEAQAAGLGIWSAAFQSPPPTDNGGVHLLGPGASAAPSCDPSYPTICLPPPPPDLDCGDIPYRQFPVLPPDDHHFDGDHDGIGCEPTPAP